ncbi:MAG: formate--tetrahydrofolate ligase, partial [Bacteroidaceae bacterium]|nr:formate--tetrahydrofolate ligase [Bacteroidaceae bacterium]
IMAILCLAQDENDLRRRIEKILLGTTIDGKPLYVKDLGIAGAICVLLKDAIHPNLVQTTEHTPAIIHGGPFANIAHGCNSIVATRMALTLGDYAITEAGFGADLGAEKFYDIKCRKSGLQPALTILVATTQGLKMHGGVSVEAIKEPNVEGVKTGLANLDKHIQNLQSFGQTVVVCFNRYATDTDEEIAICREHCEEMGIGFAVNDAFNRGGEGAVELAQLVVDTIDRQPSQPLQFAYADEQSVEEKAEAVAKKIYGAKGVTSTPAAKKKLQIVHDMGLDNYPICIAKTQYSFSQDQKAYGVPTGFSIAIRDVVINNGAEMIVLIAGDIMRMPGLPKSPQAERIDIVDGEIVGLS